MNRILLAFVTIAALASCVNSYDIQGSSNVSTFDGRLLYLKVVKDNTLKKIDSCEVVHGQFCFSGNIDSVKMANIYMDDESVMPVVLEDGDITIKIDNTQQMISGTPLNDELYRFMKSFDQLQNQSMELVHKHDQAIMDGSDMSVVNRKLRDEAEQIDQKIDELITGFITENFDNVLGPGVFMMVTANYPYPELTPWIEDIMSKATDNFKNDSYVKGYMEAAQKNQNIMNGMDTPADEPSVAPVQTFGEPAPPTPNQLAEPSSSAR